MKHKVMGRKFGRNTNQRKQLLRGLAVSLILNERVTTTEAKAKTVRPIVEKLVTLAREDSEYHRRLAFARLGNNDVATRKLFESIAPRYDGQPGGYTRIYKVGVRKGDAAPLAMIEFVA